MTHLVPLAQALGPMRDVYQHLITEAVRWQDGRPRRTDPDQFALICVATDAAPDAGRSSGSAGIGDGPRAGSERTVSPTRWARPDVYRVLRCAVPHWCALHRCAWPVDLPEAMWEWFDFLAGTGRLDPASDPLWELRKPLLCYGGLDERGRLRAGPPGGPERAAGSGPPAVACECRLPYRETAALLNRLGRRCEWHGRDPLDVLRRLAGEPTGPDDVDALLRALRDDGGDLGDLGDGRDDLDDGRDRGDRGDPGGDGVPGFPDDDPPWW